MASYQSGQVNQSALTGNEFVSIDTGGSLDAKTTTGAIAELVDLESLSPFNYSPYTGKSGINPAQHLVQLTAASSPIVAFIGDSRISLACNQIANTETLQYKIRRRIREDNPGKTWATSYGLSNFNDFSIGGQTWAAIASIPAAPFPSWYLNESIYWLTYVMASNPHTVFLNSGANDADYLDPTKVKSALQTIANWGTAPATWTTGAKTLNEIIVDSSGRLQVCTVAGTSGTSTPAWQGEYPTVGTTTTDGTVKWMILSAVAFVPRTPDIILITTESMSNRNGVLPSVTWGYLTAAAFIRTTAKSNGNTLGLTGGPNLGLIDIGRLQVMARDGIDVANQYLTQILANAPNQPVVSGTWTAPGYINGDFDLQVSFPGQAALVPAANLIFSCLVGATYNNTNGGILQQSSVQISNNSGKWLVQYYSGDGITPINNGAANPEIPTTGDIDIEIECKQSHLIVTCAGTILLDVLVPRFIGNFQPLISNVSWATNLTVTSFSTGTPAPVLPIITDAALFPEIGGPEGGAFPGHWSSYGEALIDDVALNSTAFGYEGSTEIPGGAFVALTVGASPFAYTAPSRGAVMVSGGTVSAITITRNGAVAPSGATAGSVLVCAGDIVTITWTAAPTCTFVPGS